MGLPGSADDVLPADMAGTFGWDPSSAADRWLLRPESGKLQLELSGCVPVLDAGAAEPSGMRSAEASRRSVRISADGWACAAGPDSCPEAAAVGVAAAAAASPVREYAACAGAMDWECWGCEV